MPRRSHSRQDLPSWWGCPPPVARDCRLQTLHHPRFVFPRPRPTGPGPGTSASALWNCDLDRHTASPTRMREQTRCMSLWKIITIKCKRASRPCGWSGWWRPGASRANPHLVLLGAMANGPKVSSSKARIFCNEWSADQKHMTSQYRRERAKLWADEEAATPITLHERSSWNDFPLPGQ